MITRIYSFWFPLTHHKLGVSGSLFKTWRDLIRRYCFGGRKTALEYGRFMSFPFTVSEAESFLGESNPLGRLPAYSASLSLLFVFNFPCVTRGPLGKSCSTVSISPALHNALHACQTDCPGKMPPGPLSVLIVSLRGC